MAVPDISMLPLFTDLAPAEQKELMLAARTRRPIKGEHLFHHGDPARALFIVASGAIRVYRETPEGKDVTLNIAIVGEIVGEHEAFENTPNYLCSAVAVEESTVLEYPIDWIRQNLSRHPVFALNLLSLMARASSRMAVDREHMVTLKAPQRIGCFLMRMCELHQFDPQQFTLPYSKATIASKLGMEPETFSRALAKLKEIGVNIAGNNGNIRDLSILNEYVCTACSISEDCATCEHLQQQIDEKIA